MAGDQRGCSETSIGWVSKPRTRGTAKVFSYHRGRIQVLREPGRFDLEPHPPLCLLQACAAQLGPDSRCACPRWHACRVFNPSGLSISICHVCDFACPPPWGLGGQGGMAKLRTRVHGVGTRTQAPLQLAPCVTLASGTQTHQPLRGRGSALHPRLKTGETWV